MVNCSYCNKEIDRQVFCTPSHKVMFSRNTKLTKGKHAISTFTPVPKPGKKK